MFPSLGPVGCRGLYLALYWPSGKKKNSVIFWLTEKGFSPVAGRLFKVYVGEALEKRWLDANHGELIVGDQQADGNPTHNFDHAIGRLGCEKDRRGDGRRLRIPW